MSSSRQARKGWPEHLKLINSNSSSAAATPPNQNTMNPPLDPVPFEPFPIRMCATTKVKIGDYSEKQEVHILFSARRSVEDWLRETASANISNNNNDMDEEEQVEDMMDDDDSDSLSDFDSSTSSDDDEDVEKDGEGESDSSSNDDRDMDGLHPSSQLPQDAAAATTTTIPLKAYWIRELICQTPHGHVYTEVYRATVLHKSDLHWVETNQDVAIKCMSWELIQASRNGSVSEDFVKEIYALQYLSKFCNDPGYNNGIRSSDTSDRYNGNNNHDNGVELSRKTHVMTADTIMANQSHVFIVMPYCNGGDIVQRVGDSPDLRFTESTAKSWFRQMLIGLRTLQNAHICHRDISPENFVMLNNTTTLFIDFGMCLRIPYSDGDDGTKKRRLIKPQRACGKLQHMAPEIKLQRSFDGHAADIWSLGTVLLFMLTGTRFQSPPLKDGVLDNVDLSERGVSDVAMDLLRKIFRFRPEDRLSLDEIYEHQFLQSF